MRSSGYRKRRGLGCRDGPLVGVVTGEEARQPVDGVLELRVEVDERPEPVGEPLDAHSLLAAPLHQAAHDERLWDLRKKRDTSAHGIPEWEELRELASAIKAHTLTHLDQYLEQFEAAAKANGAGTAGETAEKPEKPLVD